MWDDWYLDISYIETHRAYIPVINGKPDDRVCFLSKTCPGNLVGVWSSVDNLDQWILNNPNWKEEYGEKGEK